METGARGIGALGSSGENGRSQRSREPWVRRYPDFHPELLPQLSDYSPIERYPAREGEPAPHLALSEQRGRANGYRSADPSDSGFAVSASHPDAVFSGVEARGVGNA